MGIFSKVRSQTFEDIVEVLVGTEIGLAPDGLHKCRKPLVEPCVRPIAAGQEVAEPLMREFVRD